MSVWFRSWSKEIVIAVIIATLIEMILPNNNTKRYVKMIIGVFIMYSIFFPIVNEFREKDFENRIKYESIQKDISCTSSIKSSSSMIGTIYADNLEKDMKQRLLKMGYEADKINTVIDSESYEIKGVAIHISSKDQSKKKAYSIVKTVEHICISISSNNSNVDSVIDENDIKEIVSFISETYGVDSQNIEVN